MQPPGPTEMTNLLRAIDAAVNRAREGVRVVEDYVRFALDDAHLTRLCKQFRHDLAGAIELLPLEKRLAARETLADVGTNISTDREQSRPTDADLLTANLTRVQEALRTIEEFGKRLDSRLAPRIESLRYQAYTLQRAITITASSTERLKDARLYVLIDGSDSKKACEAMAKVLVEEGVDVLQLRDRKLDDRRLLDRARGLRDVTAGSRTLLIINDRPDIAALARADGVHVGQRELTVKDARRIVGPDALIGVSTHGIGQARRAVLDGANYLGAGPTFPSATKQFTHFPGLAYLRMVADEIQLPTFAIGGINESNIADVLQTGVRRIAVTAAVTKADDPAEAVRSLKAALTT